MGCLMNTDGDGSGRDYSKCSVADIRMEWRAMGYGAGTTLRLLYLWFRFDCPNPTDNKWRKFSDAAKLMFKIYSTDPFNTPGAH